MKLCVAASGFYPQQVVARTLHAPAPIKVRSPAERVLTSGITFDGYIGKDKRLSRARHCSAPAQSGELSANDMAPRLVLGLCLTSHPATTVVRINRRSGCDPIVLQLPSGGLVAFGEGAGQIRGSL